MKSAIGPYKTELSKPQRPWRTLCEAELATAEWGSPAKPVRFTGTSQMATTSVITRRRK